MPCPMSHFGPHRASRKYDRARELAETIRPETDRADEAPYEFRPPVAWGVARRSVGCVDLHAMKLRIMVRS